MRGAHAAQHRSGARIIAVVAAVLIVIGGAAGAIGLFRSPGHVAARTASADIQSPPSAAPAASTTSSSTAPGAASTSLTPSAEPAQTTARPSHTPSPSHTGAPTTSPIVSGTQAEREQVRELTNQQRHDNGDLPPLSMSSRLQAAAQAYAQHLAADGQFSHTDGSQLGDRITAAGYQWSAVGENLGLGQRSPAQIVAAWMASSGHRANMLNPDYVDAGVGIATRPDGQIIWCLDLGAPQ